MKALHLLAATLLAGLSFPAAAQAPIFREGQASESALIDALTPPKPAVIPGGPAAGGPSGAESPAAQEPDEGRPRMRSINVRPASRPATQAAAPAIAPRPSEPPKASILITFETNSADLTAEARRSIDVVGRALSSDSLASFQFSIEGHADPRGGSDLNQRLSQARAESVRRYLVAAHGISPERLQAVGKGDRELVNAANPTAPENRRVTIVNMSGR